LLGDKPGEEVSPIGAEEIKRLNINIDLELHNAFKAATAARSENMTDVLLKYIEDYVARYRYDMRPKKEKKERRK
jgi:ParG